MFNLFITRAKYNQVYELFSSKCKEVARLKQLNLELSAKLIKLNNRIAVAKAALRETEDYE